MELFLGLLISALVLGIIGVAIARNKGVSTGIGFALGFFLGPIGLIVVALLNPLSNSKSIHRTTQYTGSRDLASDAYRLWLTQKYSIARNDTLSRYVVNESSFPTLNDSLSHADTLEDQQINRNSIQARESAVQRKRVGVAVAALTLCIALFFGGKAIVSSFQRRQAVQVAASAIDARRQSIEEALHSAGISLLPHASMTLGDYTDLPIEELRSLSIAASIGNPGDTDLDPCSVKIAQISETDIKGKEINFYTSDSSQVVIDYYKSNLVKAGYVATNVFKEDYSNRLEYRNSHNVIFVLAIKPDQTPTNVTVCILGRAVMDKAQAELASYNSEMAAIQGRADRANQAVRRQLGMPKPSAP